MHVRVAVIGAGFGGLGAAVRLRRMGVTDFLVLERAQAIGGTWRDNTYPGCACDVPSHLYSFSFAPHPGWPRSFSRQPDIRAYLERVADTFGLRPHLRLGAEVLAAHWDEAGLRWEIRTADGARLTADVLVAATGPLSEPKLPELPGLDDFPGRVFHSARWDHDFPLRGKRVAVIGTGASAVQFVPEIQREVTELTVFQRTPPWVIPRLDRGLGPLERALHERVPLSQSIRRQLLWHIREWQVSGFVTQPERMQALEWLARLHLRRAVPDPGLRRRLIPGYRIGCKRILLSNSWYPTLTRPHVRLIDAGLREVRGATLVAEDGSRAEVDAVIFGTGFHVTDPPIARRIRGREGRTLAAHWRHQGMTALRGTTVAGFPNLLTIIGPNTGLGNSSMVLIIEAQLAYLGSFLRRLDQLGGRAALVPRPAAVAAWNERVQARLRRSVWNTGGCASWYLDAKGRNTTVWPGTTAEFRAATRALDPAEYEVVRHG